jgi:UDP-glucose 4-epimerase
VPTGVPRSVLVVGGTSFIASHLLPALADSSTTIYATHRAGATVPAANPGVQWIPVDLTGAEVTASWPTRCDTLVYLAQSRAWRRFPDDASDVFHVNVRAFFEALEYARRAGVRRCILASTGSVYDARDTPVREDDPVKINERRQMYIASKLSAELLLSAYAEFFDAICLRLFVPYGPGQSADMLIPRLVRKVLEGDCILLDGTDGLRLNPVAVVDVVEALRRCVTLDTSITLNVAGPEILSLREIGRRIGQAVGREPKFEEGAAVARTVVGDTRALKATLGWAPTTRFEHGIRGMLSSQALDTAISPNEPLLD